MKLAKIGEDWYQILINDLRLLNFEGIVRTKHAIGKRILEDELKFKRAEYGKKTIEGLAKDLNVHASDLWACTKFANEYPKFSDISENWTWYYITHKLLPETPHVSHSTGETEWDTPSEFIQSARQVMGNIDVDPASNEQANERIRADKFYSAKDNGLEKTWDGNVWMNPPYSQPLITQFCNLLVEKYKNNEIKQACVLVNNATETNFFQNMLSTCIAICFIRGRVKFIDKAGNSSGAPLQGQSILYFGKNLNGFIKEFEKFGIIMVKYHD